MGKSLLIGLIILIGISKKNYTSSEIPIINIDELREILDRKNDTTYLVHFWATWCLPCIRELPEIEKLADELQNSKFKVILISLDFENTLKTRLVPFLRKYDISSDTYVLRQERGYEWIDKINPSWNGSLPASAIFNLELSEFYEQSFEYSDLKNLLLTKYLRK